MIEIVNSIGGAVLLLSCITALIIVALYAYITKPLKILGIYFVVGASIELMALIVSLKKLNNLFFFHLFTFAEILILSMLFGHLFKELGSKLNTKFIALPVSILIVLNSVFIQGLDSYNSYSTTVVSMIIIGYCLYYFSLTLDKTTQSLESNTLKWSIVCIFFYQCISLIVLFFSNVLLEMGQTSQLIVWAIRGIIIFATKVFLVVIFSRLLMDVYFKPNSV